MSRRSTYDPLAPLDHTQWLVTSGLHRERLHVICVPYGADLRSAMIARLAELIAKGWEAEGDGLAHGFAFLSMPGARIQLSATAVDPGESYGPGHSYLAGRGAANLPAS